MSPFVTAFPPPLAAHFDLLARTILAILETPLVPGTEPARPERPAALDRETRRPGSRVWIALATTIVVVLLVGGGIWRCHSQPQPASGNPALSRGESAPVAPPDGNSPARADYSNLAGKWLIFEQVNKEHGGEEIVWNYEAEVADKRLTMRGQKARVNEAGASENRELSAAERATVSVYTLKLDGIHAEGTADEWDTSGHIYSSVKIEFSDDRRSLSGSYKTGSADVSTLTGSKQ